jgi:hypothetical protein
MIKVLFCSFLLGLVAASAATAHAQAPGRRGAPARPPEPDPDDRADAGDPADAADATTAPAAPAADPASGAGEPQTFPDEPVEATGGSVEATGGSVEATDTPAEDTGEPVEAMDDLLISATRIKLSLNMFGDGSYALRREGGEVHQEFILGALGLLARGELSPSLSGTMELVFEVDEGGATIADLERLHITWTTPRVQVLAGRLHTPFGTWNDHYHHGLWLQLPVERPYVLRFEDDGGFLPIHWIGGMVTGRFDMGTGMRLHLTGGLGNGRGFIEDAILVGGDIDENKSVFLKVELEQPGERQLRVGASGVFDVIAAQDAMTRPALPLEDIVELVGNVFVSYRSERLTLISEAYVVDHLAAGGAWVSLDMFALAGYSFGSFTPYVLVEWIDTLGGSDPFFVPDPVMYGPLPVALIEGLAGVRVDLSIWAALKGELRVTRYSDLDDIAQAVTVNWAFGI